MAAAINAASGGVIDLRPGATYIVGEQTIDPDVPQTTGYYYKPSPVLDFLSCTRPVVVRGNGAKIKCAAGLRYGTFNTSTGLPRSSNTPDFQVGGIQGGCATPYFHAIKFENCSGGQSVENLELDGNIAAQVIGGDYGPGIQLLHVGLGFYKNSGLTYLRNVYSHHHGNDGILIDGNTVSEASPRDGGVVINCRFLHNGRNNMSIVNGKGWNFENCQFNGVGKGGNPVTSPPMAGVDLECESGVVRDIYFLNCEMVDNHSSGVAAPENTNCRRVVFKRCSVIATTGWATWLTCPDFKFEDSLFVGPQIYMHNGPNGFEAVQYIRCTLTDDPTLSPTGTVAGPGLNVAEGGTLNLFFDNCLFYKTKPEALDAGAAAGTLRDCTIVHKTPVGLTRGHPSIGFFNVYGKFEGRTNIITNGNPTGYPGRTDGPNTGPAYDFFMLDGATKPATHSRLTGARI
jgi:hypothetical protein